MIYQFSKHAPMKITVLKKELERATIPVDLFLNPKDGICEMPLLDLMKNEHVTVTEENEEISVSFPNDNLLAIVVKEWYKEQLVDCGDYNVDLPKRKVNSSSDEACLENTAAL